MIPRREIHVEGGWSTSGSGMGRDSEREVGGQHPDREWGEILGADSDHDGFLGGERSISQNMRETASVRAARERSSV